MKKSFYFYTSIALLIILGLVIGNYIFGWTIPTANPPLSNLPRPIDTGSSRQPKEGYLAVGTTTTPNYPLEVGGTMQVWGQFISKVASGTAPFVIDSQTKVANLNVDLLDGYDSSDFLASTASKKYKLICGVGSSSTGCVQPTLNSCPSGWTDAGFIGYDVPYDSVDGFVLCLTRESAASGPDYCEATGCSSPVNAFFYCVLNGDKIAYIYGFDTYLTCLCRVCVQ